MAYTEILQFMNILLPSEINTSKLIKSISSYTKHYKVDSFVCQNN